MFASFENDWDLILKEELEKDYFVNLTQRITNEYSKNIVYPCVCDIFNALKYTSYNDVKAVILGQDPYHNPKQAHGLSFSVLNGNKIPPSLRNIYKELHNDLGYNIPHNTDLRSWAKQGVLLLNSILTVKKDEPLSHKNYGWELFTDKIIEILNNKKSPVVFILWGKFAQSKEYLITNKDHLVIKSNHPSPLSASRGFFGSRPFSKANTFLKYHSIDEINWEIK